MYGLGPRGNSIVLHGDNRIQGLGLKVQGFGWVVIRCVPPYKAHIKARTGVLGLYQFYLKSNLRPFKVPKYLVQNPFFLGIMVTLGILSVPT